MLLWHSHHGNTDRNSRKKLQMAGLMHLFKKMCEAARRSLVAAAYAHRSMPCNKGVRGIDNAKAPSFKATGRNSCLRRTLRASSESSDRFTSSLRTVNDSPSCPTAAETAHQLNYFTSKPRPLLSGRLALEASTEAGPEYLPEGKKRLLLCRILKWQHYC